MTAGAVIDSAMAGGRAAQLSANIARIRERIAALTDADVAILAATKGISADIINTLPRYNITIAGENRAQELSAKYGEVKGVEWHFIGRLQTNKVKYIIDKVRLIHSVDSLRLAEEIDRQCMLKGIDGMDVLLEVNIGGEAAKGGVTPTQLMPLAREIVGLNRVRICGLMAVMPKNSEKEENLYLQMARLYGILKEDMPKEVRYLSMGMSSDFETAVKYGANIVRLGSMLFGERNKVNE